MTARISAVGKVSMWADAGFRCSVTRPSSFTSNQVHLSAEGTAAPAGALDIGIVELKSRPFHGFHVVHLGAVQVQQAGLIDEHLQIVELVGLIQHVRGVFESHGIAKSRASAAYYCDTEPG